MPPLQQTPVVGVHRPARRGVNMSRVVWEGVDEFGQWLHDTPGIVVKDVEAALKQEGSNIMGVSKRRTPVDVGNLRASGHVKLPETKQGKTSVTLAYGTDYAVYVHEILTNQHPVGQAKFLESAVKEGMDGMVGRIKDRVLDRIGRRT